MEKVKLRKQKVNFLNYLITFLLIGCSGTTVNQEYFNKTLGLNITIKEKIFNSKDAISPQGEGFTMEVIAFDRKDSDSLFVKGDYPKTYDLRNDWKISKWVKTPLANKDILELLFNYNINDNATKMQLVNLKSVVSSNSNYISYYFKESDGNIYAVDICVLDIKNKKIYLCEIIT